MANRTLKLFFVCTMLFTLLTANLAMAETVIDIYVGDIVTTIIDDDDSTSGYYYESTIEGSAGYFTEASRTIDMWTDGSSVDKFYVTDEWAGGHGFVNIETYFDSNGFEVYHYLHEAGGWIGGTQTVSNGFGADDSDLWIDNRLSVVEGELYIDTDYLSYGDPRPSAYADFDVLVSSDELWFESHGTYTDDHGGLEYMSSHVWGQYYMEFGIDDYASEDYEFRFTAEASDTSSEAYIRFYDFSVTPRLECTQDYFSVLLDTFWSNMYGNPEAHIFANGDHGLDGIIETSIGPPPPFMVINGWLKGW